MKVSLAVRVAFTVILYDGLVLVSMNLRAAVCAGGVAAAHLKQMNSTHSSTVY
jgi:hypothetical protein